MLLNLPNNNQDCNLIILPLLRDAGENMDNELWNYVLENE